MKAPLCSLLVILILAVTLCPDEGVTATPLAGVTEEGFKLRWKLIMTDLTEAEIWSFNIQTSRDGGRTLVGYSSADGTVTTVMDRNGKKILTGPASTFPTISAISSDGRILVASVERGEEEESVLVWYDVNTGHQFQNATLGTGSAIHSLAISDNAGLVAVSGVVWSNYTFIYAFDSQGRRLWSFVSKPRELVGYHEFSYLLSTVAVSGDGLHVAATLRDMTVRFWGVCGGNNGVVLFDTQGEPVWNYSSQECVWNVAVSGDGRNVVASSYSELYGFDSEGKLLWSRPFSGGTLAMSDSGRRFVAGDYDGTLLLGNESGSYWETQVHGQVVSVGISDNGDISTALVSRSYSTSTIPLLYVLNDEGRLLLNYSYPGSSLTAGASRVAIAGDGCCIVAALETDGVYYFERSKAETETTATPASTGTRATVEIGNMQTAGTLVLLGASGLIALLYVIAKSRAKSHDGTRRTA